MKRLIGIALILGLTVTAGASTQAPTRELSKVAGDGYRFQDRFHVALVVLTGAGVVVSDPINADAATWLKAELANLGDQPVTHMNSGARLMSRAWFGT
jgi:hypothetical protein